MKKFGFIFVVFAFIFVACGGGGGGGEGGPSAPNTTIDNNSMGITSEGLTSQNTATFNYSTSSTEAVGYQCSLNGAGWEGCQGGTKTYPDLGDGAYTFQVKAYLLDDNQKEDKTPASFTWTIDTTGPTVTLDVVPDNPTNTTSGQIQFTHDGVSASCDLDGVVTESCISPFSYPSLDEGSHVFEVTSLDELGNPASDSYTWQIDLTGPPVTSYSKDPADTTVVVDVPITFYFGNDFANNPEEEEIATAQHQLWVTYSAPECLAGGHVPIDPDWIDSIADGGTWKTAEYTPGPNGECVGANDEYFIKIKVTDQLGNETIWSGADNDGFFTVIEYQPLSLSFKASPPSDIAEGSTSNETADVKIYFEETNHDDADVSYECNLNDSGWLACDDEDADGHYYSAGSIGSPLQDGVQTLKVKAEHLNIEEVEDVEQTITWTVDNTPPNASVDSGPDDITNETNVTFTYSSSEGTLSAPDTTFECKLEGNNGITIDWQLCPDSGKLYQGLQEGTYLFEVRANDIAGNTSVPANDSFSIDKSNPETTIDSGPPELSGSDEATFTFSSNEANSTFHCNLDNAGWENCSSPKTYTELSGGPHSFSVRAEDEAGNIDGSPAFDDWDIDLSIPDTLITDNPEEMTNLNIATFQFVSPEGGNDFECQVTPDENSYSPCNGGSRTYTELSEGTKTFYVRALNNVGTPDPTPAEFTWTIDQTPPETSITLEPATYTNEDNITWEFGADETAPFFQCKLSTGAWSFCTSPKTYELLSEGTHTFEVRAWDEANNIDGTPATSTTNVDRSSPVTTIESSPTDPSNETDGSFGVSVVDDPWEGIDGSLPGLTEVLYCITNDETCVGQAMTSDGSGAYSAGYSSLLEGTWTFKAWAEDLAGNIEIQGSSATHTWTIDTTGAQTEITSGPDDPTNATIPVFEFKESSDDPDATFECRLYISSSSPGNWESCESPKIYNAQTDESYTFEVKAFDSLGNEDVSPATWTWTIDTTSPTTQIDSGPDDPTTSTSAIFDFSSPSDVDATFECELDGDGTSFSSCLTGIIYSDLTDGAHSFKVRSIDAAGNVDPTSSEYLWTIDITGPVTSIDSAPMDPTNSLDAAFTWTTDEPGTSECNIDSEGWVACTSPQAYTGLEQNASHTFEVRSTDSLGNQGAADSWTWTIDTINPTTVVLTGPVNPSNDVNPTLTYESPQNPDATFQCDLDGGGLVQCDGGSFTYSNLSEGTHVFSVFSTDAAGNTDPDGDTWTWDIDLTPSETYIDSGPSDPTNETDAVFDYRDDETTDYFMCKLNEGNWEQCDGSQKSYSGLSEGVYIFMVKSIDEAGNEDLTPAEWNWTVDLTEPDTTITDSPPNPTPDPTATFAFESSEPNSTFECNLDGLGWENCSTPKTYTGLADGNHSFEVRATDAAGNTDSSPSLWNWLIDSSILPPDTFIDSTPPAKTFLTTAIFEFSSDDVEATFECSLNNESWSTCTSPQNYENIPTGDSNFRVRAVNGAGLKDPTPASYDWIIITDLFSNLTSGPDMQGSFFTSAATTDVKLEWSDGYTDYEKSHCTSSTPSSAQCEYTALTYQMTSSENGNKRLCPAVDGGQYDETGYTVDCSNGYCGEVLTGLVPDAKYCFAIRASAPDGSTGTLVGPTTALTYPTYMYDNFEGDVIYDEAAGTGNWISTQFGNTETTFFQVWSSTDGSAYSGNSFIAAWNPDTQNYDNDEDPVFITAKALDLSKTMNPALVMAHQVNRPPEDFEDISLWINTDPSNTDNCFNGQWTPYSSILNDIVGDIEINPSLDTTDWEYLYLDISEFAGNPNVCIGIGQRTNSEGTDTGILFDDIQLVEQPDFTKTLFYEPFPGNGESCSDQHAWTEMGYWIDDTQWWRVIPGDDGNLDCKMWMTGTNSNIGNYLDGWTYDDASLQITYPWPSGDQDGANGYYVSEGGWTRLTFNELYETPSPSTFGIVVRWSDTQITDCYVGGNVWMYSRSAGDTFATGSGVGLKRTIDLSPFRGKYVCFIFWGEDAQTSGENGDGQDGIFGAGWQIDEVIVDTK